MPGASGPWAEGLQDLGLQLRRSREAQGLAAETVADQLRIGVEQLQALENADLDRLPEPVFVIAQARRVAGALRLDIEPQLATLRTLSDGASRSSQPLVRSAPQANRQAPKVPWRIPVSLVALLLIGGGLWGLWRGFEALGPGRSSSTPAVTTRNEPSRPSKAAASQPESKSAEDSASLVLTGRRPSWVEVRRPGGETLFEGLFQGSRRFPIGEGLEVLAGRPDLVEAQLGSGPSRVLGPISDVRWQRFAPPR